MRVTYFGDDKNLTSRVLRRKNGWRSNTVATTVVLAATTTGIYGTVGAHRYTEYYSTGTVLLY